MNGEVPAKLREQYVAEHQQWWTDNDMDGDQFADFTDSEIVWCAARWYGDCLLLHRIGVPDLEVTA